MKRNTSQEAYYERLRNLAKVNQASINESQNRSLGTLVDFKRASDGVAYGIIKENHHYYIKKGGLKEQPNVADFAYIGGLQNITEFQYKSLAEADKQRNMLLHTINESISKPLATSGKKRRLNEDKAGEEIEASAEMAAGLDAANNAPAPEATPAPEGIPAEEPAPEAAPAEEPAPAGEEMPAEEPAPESGEEVAPEAGSEEAPAEEPAPESEENPEGEETEPEGEKPEGEQKDITTQEIEKSLGKLTNKIRKTEMTDSQIKSYVNTFLSAFKDKFPDVEIEDRKAMAEKITKVVPDEEIEDLEQNVEATDKPEAVAEEEEMCAECGSFARFAESRGYNAQSIQECGEEEMTSLVSGYANAHNDGMNDGDFKAVALFISPEILEKLRGDYGHDEYADKLTPYANEMSESSEEDKAAQINELFGGLGSLAKSAGQGIVKGVKNAAGAVADKAGQVKQAVGQAAQNIKQTYNAGEINPEVKKLETMAADLGKQVAALNKRMVGAGKEPVNVKSILATIQNQVSTTGAANLNKFRTAESVDPAALEVEPLEEVKVAEKAGKKLSTKAPVKQITEEEEEKPEEVDIDALDVDTKENAPEEKPEVGFAPAAQTLGVGTVKPDGAATTGVDITVNPDKTVNIQMSESEVKLRKYIRNRLQECAGLKKPMMNEDKKSPTLKKLDEMIDKQFKMYESVMRKKLK